MAVLLARWRPGTYLGLEVAWFLPPIILQLLVGADGLWLRRRLVASQQVSFYHESFGTR